MEDKKDFSFLAKQLVAVVDFIKWTSSFSADAIRQMETPVSGIRLSPALSSLFALAKDELGWMLTMHENEGSWLADLPLAEAYVGFDDGLILVTEPLTIFDQPFEQLGVQLFIPHAYLREELATNRLLGFGLMHAATGKVERVNRMIPLYNPTTYETKRRQHVRMPSRGLFSQQ